MLTMNELKKGMVVLIEGQPHIVLDAKHQKRANEEAVLQTKLRNIITGATLSRNFKQADRFEEADIEKIKLIFLFSHRGQFGFVEPQDRSKRHFLQEEEVGEKKQYFKEGTEVDAVFFDGRIIDIQLPVKVELKVVEAPPGVRGDTAQGGTKAVKLETGATIQAPLFIEIGDIVRVNTEKGEYVERAEKAR